MSLAIPASSAMSLRFSDSARVERSERRASRWARSERGPGPLIPPFFHWVRRRSLLTPRRKRFVELVSNAHPIMYIHHVEYLPRFKAKMAPFKCMEQVLSHMLNGRKPPPKKKQCTYVRQAKTLQHVLVALPGPGSLNPHNSSHYG